LFLIGIVLAWAAMWKGDLSLAIPIHAGVNLLAAILLVWGTDLLNWLEQQTEELDQIKAVVDGVLAVIHTIGL
jgi:hypothetical protein